MPGWEGRYRRIRSAAVQAIRSLTGTDLRLDSRRVTSRRSAEGVPPATRATSATLTTLMANGPVVVLASSSHRRAVSTPRRLAMRTSLSTRINAGRRGRGDATGRRGPSRRGVGRREVGRRGMSRRPGPRRGRRRPPRWRPDRLPGHDGRPRPDPGRPTDGQARPERSPASGPRRRGPGTAPPRGRYWSVAYIRTYITKEERPTKGRHEGAAITWAGPAPRATVGRPP